jgi:hypothetical protein
LLATGSSDERWLSAVAPDPSGECSISLAIRNRAQPWERSTGPSRPPAEFRGRYCVVYWADMLKWPADFRSDRLCEFGESSRDPLGGCSLDTELVVPAAQVLHEGMPGDDYLR